MSDVVIHREPASRREVLDGRATGALCGPATA